MRRRLLSLAMALAMALSLLPTAALAEEAATLPATDGETEIRARDGETVTVSTEAELIAALESGANNVTIVLNNNITLEETIEMQSGSFTLDMDGHTLTYSADLTGGTAGLIDMNNTAELTVTGNGEFTFNDDYVADASKSIGYTFRLDGSSHLTIENGTFYCGLTCIQLGGTSSADIYGGDFSALAPSALWRATLT